MPQKKKSAHKPAGKKIAQPSKPANITRLYRLLHHSRVRPLLRFALIWSAAWLVMVSFYGASVLKNKNYLEVFPHEMLFPIVLHGVTGLLIAGVLYRLRKPSLVVSKLLMAVLLALFMVGYDDRLRRLEELLKALSPILPSDNELPVASAGLLVVLFLIVMYVGRSFETWFVRQNKIESSNLITGIMVIVLFVFCGQAIRVGRMLPSLQKQSSVVAPGLPPSSAPADPEKPDIFYLVFDRYASDKVLREQFNYDNSGFTERLKAQGFVVQDNATSNYPYTTQSIASTLNVDYLNKQTEPFVNDPVQSRTLYHNLIHKSSVIQALKKNGYGYHHIGSWYGASSHAPQADVNHVFEHNVMVFGKEIRRLSGLEAVTFKGSPFYRFSQIKGVSWWPLKSIERYGSAMAKAQLAQLSALSAEAPKDPKFVFAHILLPHDPFYFNADGSLSSHGGNDDEGKLIKQKYIDQVKFVNTQIQKTIENILKNTNGRAVILLNPDEGAHPNVLDTAYVAPHDQELASTDSDMREWRPEWLRMKYGIHRAVYIPKATANDYENLSSVNLFRIVLNRYLGYGLPYLPDCNYGLTRGSVFEFDYVDITEKLTGTPNQACAQFESH